MNFIEINLKEFMINIVEIVFIDEYVILLAIVSYSLFYNLEALKNVIQIMLKYDKAIADICIIFIIFINKSVNFFSSVIFY